MKGHRRNLMILEINLNDSIEIEIESQCFRYSLFTSFCFSSAGTTSSTFLV